MQFYINTVERESCLIMGDMEHILQVITRFSRLAEILFYGIIIEPLWSSCVKYHSIMIHDYYQ